MASLTITIKPHANHHKRILVEMDVEKLERLASALGLFNPEFLKSLDRAERDYKAGRIKKIKSLKELRR
jgi:predicted nucleic acid-binding protein